MNSHSGDGKPWADSMLQVVRQFYTITRSCVVHSLVWYECVIVWRWGYNFNIHIHIHSDMEGWVIYRFTKEIILNLLIERETFVNDVKLCNNRSKSLQDILIWVSNVKLMWCNSCLFETLQVHKNVPQFVQHAMHVVCSVLFNEYNLSAKMHYKWLRSYVMI